MTSPSPVVIWKRQSIQALVDLSPDRPHAVYSLFDQSGNLIYVGISSEPRVRIRSHHRSATWRAQIDAWSATWYANRADAEAAEVALIAATQPRFNVRGTPRFRERCMETNPSVRRRNG